MQSIVSYPNRGKWGTKSHPDDLSHCASYEEFITKLNHVNAKIYASLRNGGRHAILIGDIRRNEKYYSIMKDMQFYGELESHVIKAQHNCWSDKVEYKNRNFIPIVHEHLLVFKKKQLWQIPIVAVKKIDRNVKETDFITWRNLVQATLEELGDSAKIEDINKIVEGTEKAKKSQYWKEKIKKTLQKYDEFTMISNGSWQIR